MRDSNHYHHHHHHPPPEGYSGSMTTTSGTRESDGTRTMRRMRDICGGRQNDTEEPLTTATCVDALTNTSRRKSCHRSKHQRFSQIADAAECGRLHQPDGKLNGNDDNDHEQVDRVVLELFSCRNAAAFFPTLPGFPVLGEASHVTWVCRVCNIARSGRENLQNYEPRVRAEDRIQRMLSRFPGNGPESDSVHATYQLIIYSNLRAYPPSMYRNPLKT